MQVVQKTYTETVNKPVTREVTKQVIVTSDGQEWNMSDQMRANKHEARLLLLKELDLQDMDLPMYNYSIDYAFSKTLCIPDNVNRDHLKVLNEFIINDLTVIDDSGFHYYDSFGKIKPLVKGKYLVIVNEDHDGYRYCQFFGTISEYITEASTYICELNERLKMLETL